MKSKIPLLLALMMTIACTTVPLTGRKQLSLIPNSEILPMSFTSYQDILKNSILSTDPAENALVATVGQKIRGAVETYLAQHNLMDLVEGYEWEFHVIDNDTMINAFCLPGGKVAFYSGILPVCRDEAGVAVVMGHEVAHAIASHGRERLSQGLVQQLGGLALAVAIQDKPAETQALFMSAYAIGTTLGAMLTYSRLHESEADKLGMIFMAMAGYDPAEAPAFWKRMDAATSGHQIPQWLSTHPSNQKRIDDLNEFLPQAQKYYRKTTRSKLIRR